MSFAPVQAPMLAPVRTSDLNRSGGARRPSPEAYNCGAVAHALAETGRVEDDRKLSRFHNGFYLQGDRSTTYAERAADCKLARLRAAGEAVRFSCDGALEPFANVLLSLRSKLYRVGSRSHGCTTPSFSIQIRKRSNRRQYCAPERPRSRRPELTGLPKSEPERTNGGRLFEEPRFHNHIVELGSRPSRYWPTVSKCSCRPCTCCETVWMSRKRRSNGFCSKIAVEPAAWYAVSTTCND
jgi:hypothetical protein